jgi:hypothetical protein
MKASLTDLSTRSMAMVSLLAVPFGFAFFGQPLYSDSVDYYEMSLEFLKGKQPSFYWPLGWPLMLAAVQSIFGESQLVAKAFTFCLALLTLWVQLLIVRRGMGEATSPRYIQFAYGIIIFNGLHFLYHANFAATIIPTAFFGTLLVYAILFTNSSVAIALLLAAMTTVRFGSIFLLPFVVLYQSLTHKTYGFMLKTVLLVMLLVSIPVGVVSYKLGGLVLLNTSNVHNLFRGNHSLTPMYETWRWTSIRNTDEERRAREALSKNDIVGADGLAGHRAMKQEAIRQILQHPAAFLFRTLTRTSALLAFDSSIGADQIKKNHRTIGIMLLLAMLLVSLVTKLSAVLGLLGTDWEGRHLIWCVLSGLSIPHIIAMGHPSYFQMFMNVAAPVIAVAIGQMKIDRLKSSFHAIAGMTAVILLCHGLFIYYMWKTRF